MRVTHGSQYKTLIDQLGSLAGRQARFHAQVATGQRVQKPADDPMAVRRVIDLQAEASSVQQFMRNVARHQELAEATFGSLKLLKKISDRAGEIAILADGTKSPDQLAIYSAEVTELIKQGVQLANSRNRGDYLFAGTRVDRPPFEMSVDSAGKVLAVTYNGNSMPASSELADGVLLSSQVAGSNQSGTGPRGLVSDSSAGADFFNHLISLQNNLLAGDISAVSSVDRAQLARDEDNFIFHLGQNGATQARLEAADAILRNRSASIEHEVSRQVDADLAQTLVRLNETQVAYQAALQSGARIIDLSLLNYLR
jgi:flagellar hook-associated protein 3 FlgL